MKYPIGTKVYVLMKDILIKGIIINQRLSFSRGIDFLPRNEYLIRYTADFKDGLIHGAWHEELEISKQEE